ncbi:MAG: SPOCS domain-containing protein, partial [Acetivibrionales bacterium]
MQMELLKKPIRSYRTIEIRETEEMLENSIIVPDSKPDIKDIILADAECFVTSVEKSGRMVEVGGEIKYRILYRSDTPDQRIESIVTQFSWSFSVQKPKTDTEIGIFSKSHSQHTEANVVNGRKIVARTVCSIISRFYEIKTDEVGREILGENIYLKTTPVNVVSLKDSGDIMGKVSNVLSLPHGSPAIKEILFSRINIGSAELSYKEDDPCIEAKGTAFLLYRSDTIDESIESVVLEFPIKTATGIQAVPNEMVFTTSVLKSWELEALEDADGLLTQVSVNLELQVDA